MKNKEGAAGKNASNHAQNAESAIALRGGNTVVDAPQGRQETGFSVSLPGPASVHGGGGGGGGGDEPRTCSIPGSVPHQKRSTAASDSREINVHGLINGGDPAH